MEYQDKITSLENENSLLKQQLNEIQEHLKKYTAPTRAKKLKSIIKQHMKNGNKLILQNNTKKISVN